MATVVLLLLVEDEKTVAFVAKTILEDGGYSVMQASTGNEAIEILNQRIDEIAALVTDIKIPGPDGWEVARHGRELNPDLPVVYTTADSAGDWPVKGVPKSLLLEKPYAEAQLLTAVSSLLIQGNGSS
jgi:CheY-like chemotaxis protein